MPINRPSSAIGISYWQRRFSSSFLQCTCSLNRHTHRYTLGICINEYIYIHKRTIARGTYNCMTNQAEDGHSVLWQPWKESSGPLLLLCTKEDFKVHDLGDLHKSCQLCLERLSQSFLLHLLFEYQKRERKGCPLICKYTKK